MVLFSPHLPSLEEQDDLSLNPLLHTYSLSPAELLKHRHYETSLMDVVRQSDNTSTDFGAIQE